MMTSGIAEAIAQGARGSQLRTYAETKGFVGIRDQANELVRQIIVSQEEAFRALGVE